MSDEDKTVFRATSRVDFGTISEAGLFSTGSVGTINRNTFLDEALISSPPLNIEWTFEIRPHMPTRWQKFRTAISDAFHPVTKYRLRLVNTDYEGWD